MVYRSRLGTAGCIQDRRMRGPVLRSARCKLVAVEAPEQRPIHAAEMFSRTSYMVGQVTGRERPDLAPYTQALAARIDRDAAAQPTRGHGA
jgi:hypothetical protein